MPENYNYTELIGVVFGIICVILTAKESIWCWPTGIISTVIFLYLYSQQTLYLNVLLHIFFLVACIVGWYQWLYGGENKSHLKISNTKKKDIWKLVAITLAMFIFFGVIADYISDDKMPYLDALLSSMSFVGQWMMNNKLTECWLVWVVTDIIYTIMHYKMHNYLTSIMYLTYVFFAISGYYLWMKSLKKSQTAT